MINLVGALNMLSESWAARDRGDHKTAETIWADLEEKLAEVDRANEAAGRKPVDLDGVSTADIAAMLLVQAGGMKTQ